MRSEFVKAETIEEAYARCPWAATVLEVEGGFHAFESVVDVEQWRRCSDASSNASIDASPRSEFIQADTQEAAAAMAPWATMVTRFDNGIQRGFWAFESVEDYHRWIDQATESPSESVRTDIMDAAALADLNSLEGIADLQASIASTLDQWRAAIASGCVSMDAVSP